MNGFWLAVFGTSFATCAYIYFGYPSLIWLLSRLRPRPVAAADVTPSVSIIVAAHNEEDVISEKIANCLALDYPPEQLEVLVGSNASTDATDDIVRKWAAREERVRLIVVPRQGKAFALNEAARQARGEVLAFTDANIVLESGSLRQLVRSYADPQVGAVTGNKRTLRPEGADATAEGEGVYWRYEMWQKRLESSIGSCYIGDGSLHSIRKALYVPIPDPALGDDVSISTRAVLQGYRLIFEPGAVALEDATTDSGNEIQRKIRITNRSMSALLGLKGALWTSGFYSLQLLSHKFFRHLIPLFLITMLVSNVALAREPGAMRIVLGLQLAFYGLALFGYLLRDSRWGRAKLFWIPYYFTLVNTAALFGVIHLVRGHRAATWTPRSGADLE